MNKCIERVIAVAKDKEEQLLTIGHIATNLFKKDPNTAYERVTNDLVFKEIPFLDLHLNVRDLPECLGCWYFQKPDMPPQKH